ncbi:hypothetical protein H6F90_04770 [Trichocoleus sp. FACHB-591]|uniref:hypothetical protein n=1 Tax=Trichocoleus sp. FACHB-591 TaxID=2692872 RepID=UPI00168340E6|nr:hypothetical protein [Trichocoleus sp. FACHB-591]MBD2094463.1 hypothetical protein [Trichocoleus sp. FACHB-591]
MSELAVLAGACWRDGQRLDYTVPCILPMPQMPIAAPGRNLLAGKQPNLDGGR